jgi:hypothetical protein
LKSFWSREGGIRELLSCPNFYGFLEYSRLFKKNMLRFIFFILAALIFDTSCHPEYKKCNCESKNEELKAYSEIINEIVEHRSYNMYLGKNFERIWDQYAKSDADTAKIRKDVYITNSAVMAIS